MKYNEQIIKKLMTNEDSIWKADDLDWFDKKLVEKLQSNKLPELEKLKLINMMANDQAVMNKYLSLKKQTIAKQSWISQLLQAKQSPLLAIGLTLVFVITIVISLNITSSTNIEDIDKIRGVKVLSAYPINASTLETAPEYFVVQNKYSNEIKVSIISDNKILWSSDYQKSNKFYLPLKIKQQLKTGHYNWMIESKNSDINEQYSFNIH